MVISEASARNSASTSERATKTVPRADRQALAPQAAAAVEAPGVDAEEQGAAGGDQAREDGHRRPRQVAGDGHQPRPDRQHEHATPHRHRPPHRRTVDAQERREVRARQRPHGAGAALDTGLVVGQPPGGAVGRHRAGRDRRHEDHQQQERGERPAPAEAAQRSRHDVLGGHAVEGRGEPVRELERCRRRAHQDRECDASPAARSDAGGPPPPLQATTWARAVATTSQSSDDDLGRGSWSRGTAYAVTPSSTQAWTSQAMLSGASSSAPRWSVVGLIG